MTIFSKAWLPIGCLAGVSLGFTFPARAGNEATVSADKAVIHAQPAAPTALSLELRGMEESVSFGMHLVQPLIVGHDVLLLGEAYGLKGDSQLGMMGAGLIVRYRTRTGGILEFNGFFEGLQNREGFSYPQIGLGAAYSYRWMTARANGYLPLRGGDDRRTRTRRWTEVERNRGFNERVESVEWSQETFMHRSPMAGFDVEVELQLPEPPRWLDPHLTVGYFYRGSDDRRVTHSGPLVRGELHFGEHWIAEAEWRNDAAEIDQEWRISLRYQYFFGGRRTVAESGETSALEPASWSALYGPAERQPWPTVSSRVERRVEERGRTRAVSQPVAPVEQVEDCCESGKTPLVFE